MKTFSFRVVYLQRADPVSGNVYRERLVLFSAPSLERALALAQEESARYLALDPQLRRISDFEVFEHDPERGAEIWSTLSRSLLKPVEYLNQRYNRFEYRLGSGA